MIADGLRQSRLFRVLRALVSRFFQDGVSRAAAELAYYLLFSLFPLLIFLHALIGAFQLDLQSLVAGLEAILPPQVYGIIADYVAYVGGLRAPMLLSSVLGVWSIARAVRSVLRATAQAYRVQTRGWLQSVLPVLVTLVLMASVLALMVLLLVSRNLLNTIARYVGLPRLLVALWNLIKFLVAPGFVFFVLTGLYHVASRRRYRLRQAMPGALFCCVMWTAFSVGFSYYVSNFGRYSVLYGSLGAIIILMLWLYATGLLLITGGELNHVLIEIKPKGREETENE